MFVTRSSAPQFFGSLVLCLAALAGCGQRTSTTPLTPALQQAGTPEDVTAQNATSPYLLHVVPLSLFAYPGGAYGTHPVPALAGIPGQAFFGATAYGGSNACASGCGVVYKLTPKANGSYTETVMHSFALTDGENPRAPLYEDSSGNLFGSTQLGGDYGQGTIYEVTSGGAFSVLYSFKGGSDGAQPASHLIKVGTKLYGTTLEGGGTGCSGNGCGTVYELTPAGSGYTEQVIYAFAGGSDGWHPWGGLLSVNGVLYGTTYDGGNTGCGGRGCGTVYQLVLSGTAAVKSTIYTFAGTQDGSQPHSRMVYLNGLLYGTALHGGSTLCSMGCGTFFSLDPSTKAFTVLHPFTGGTDGADPYVGLTIANNIVYGATLHGGVPKTCDGVPGCGVIFAWGGQPSYQIVYKFPQPADALSPASSVFGYGGTVYGTTGDGGKYGFGNVFKLVTPSPSPSP